MENDIENQVFDMMLSDYKIETIEEAIRDLIKRGLKIKKNGKKERKIKKR